MRDDTEIADVTEMQRSLPEWSRIEGSLVR